MKWEEREGGAQGRRREERFLTWRICKLEAWSYKMVFIRNDFKHGNGTNFRCQHGSKGREGKYILPQMATQLRKKIRRKEDLLF